MGKRKSDPGRVPKNFLYYGDNLDILRRYVEDESVDLVYLDPPFNSDADYNVLFAEKDGTQAHAQIKAFEDSWTWDEEAAREYHEVLNSGHDRVARALKGLHDFLGGSDMLAYLSMMALRLIELRRVLKQTGSIYLHCDPTASHYLKIVMDSVFGPDKFRNEIIWRRTGSHNSSKRFGPIHDVILFYSKGDSSRFNRVFRPYMKGHVEGYFKSKDDRGRYWTNSLTGAGQRGGASGLPWRKFNPTAVGRHWAIPGKLIDELGIDPDLSPQAKLDALDAAGYIQAAGADSRTMPTYRQYLHTSRGMPIPDIWAYQPHTRETLYGTDEGIDEDVRWLVAQGDNERLGYPTQKPEGLLERIISSSTDENDLVLDPFCGCGTAVAAAQKLKRRWIGIDITHLAINLIKVRLADAFGPKIAETYEVIGEPEDLESAKALAEQDKYQFQYWALGLVGARPMEEKKGADKGIDGRLYITDAVGETKSVVISVKGGGVTVSQIRDLRGVVEREEAAIGVFITLEPPTGAMRKEAADAGFFQTKTLARTKHSRIQILTIKELLAGKRIDFPLTQDIRSFKQAPRARQAKKADATLPFD